MDTAGFESAVWIIFCAVADSDRPPSAIEGEICFNPNFLNDRGRDCSHKQRAQRSGDEEPRQPFTYSFRTWGKASRVWDSMARGPAASADTATCARTQEKPSDC